MESLLGKQQVLHRMAFCIIVFGGLLLEVLGIWMRSKTSALYLWWGKKFAGKTWRKIVVLNLNVSVYPFLFIFHLIRWYLEVKGGEEKRYRCFLLISIAMFPFFFPCLTRFLIIFPLLFVVENRKSRKEKIRKTKQNWLTLARTRGGELDLSTVPEISFLSVFNWLDFKLIISLSAQWPSCILMLAISFFSFRNLKEIWHSVLLSEQWYAFLCAYPLHNGLNILLGLPHSVPSLSLPIMLCMTSKPSIAAIFFCINYKLLFDGFGTIFGTILVPKCS